jgi:hypothetical protein
MGLGRSDIANETLVASSEFAVVGTSPGQAKGAIRSASNHIRIVVVLAVVFPETDWADFEASPLAQCAAETARTANWEVRRLSIEPPGVRIEPCSSPSQLLWGDIVIVSHNLALTA